MDGEENTQGGEPVAAVSTSTNPVIATVEDIIEEITGAKTPEESAGILLGWVIKNLTTAIGLGGMGATKDAVAAHLADLEQNKESLAQAVAA